MYRNEEGYLNLLEEVMMNGNKKEGRNGITYSSFGSMLKFDVNDGLSFPLITTKKMFFKGIVEELLWMLRGSVNSKELEAKGVNIWKGNSSRAYLDAQGFYDYDEGYLGPIYGFQWRNFNGKTDQIKFILEELSLNNSRRAVLSAWNPVQLKEQALPPCHLIYNFYKNDDETLSCMMYMRSSDLFLGLPFNIASTSLLTIIIAKVMNLKVKEIAISICDCHIYEEHLEPVKEQLLQKTNIYKSPEVAIVKSLDNSNELSIDEKIKWIESLTFDDFCLNNYNHHKALKAPMK
jgi:thymidylate synthase